jgi:hypothetical protein
MMNAEGRILKGYGEDGRTTTAMEDEEGMKDES